MFLVPEFNFFFVHYGDSSKYPNINLPGISSAVVILLAMKLAAREVEVRIPALTFFFFFFFFFFLQNIAAQRVETCQPPPLFAIKHTKKERKIK